MKALRFAPAALFILASCSSPAAPEPAMEVAVANPQPEPGPKAESPAPKKETPVVAAQPKKEEPPAPPPEFPFPKDESGKLLPKVVTPPMPALPTAERLVKAPKERPVPKVIRDPDPLPKVVHPSPPLTIAKPVAAPPTAPAERVPLDLGFGASAVPERPKLPEAPGNAVKARDVNLPPELAPLGRPVQDRASLDDPTSEPGNAMIANRSPTLSLGIAAFLKVVLPDPFELGEQVKPKVPAAAEPNPAPMVVNPQRMK